MSAPATVPSTAAPATAAPAIGPSVYAPGRPYQAPAGKKRKDKKRRHLPPPPIRGGTGIASMKSLT